MKAAYFDCFAGASGDMILGAVLDADVSVDSISDGLSSLNLPAFKLSSRRARRGAIAGTQALVEVDQEHRYSPKQILDLVAGSSLPSPVREKSAAVFRRLAEAEGRIHGHHDGEDVPFHEVGAVDALVDVVGSVLGLHLLGVEEVFVAPLPSGGGTVRSSHGVLPVPAPATIQLIASAGAPVQPNRLAGVPQTEMVTPTGAAILTTLGVFQEPALRLERIAYGVGGRDLGDFPNVLPLWLGEKAGDTGAELYLLETNIDDSTPEIVGFVMERLFALGARDAWFTPIQMKKNRPAVMVSVLVTAAMRGAALETLLRETSTLGVRAQPIIRHEADREELRFSSSLGEVGVKMKRARGKISAISPEYEDCRRLAVEKDLPLPEVYRIVEREAWERLGE